MPEYLDDPSVLTKDKLKSELVANNVDLPSGEQKKDIYVQLYLKNLTVQNKKTTLEAFSSDEELAPSLSNKTRSGRKATKKTDKPRLEDLDASELTDQALKDELLKYGVNAGPIVASTRKLYERKLQKLLGQGPPEAITLPVVVTEIDGNLNGSNDTDRYSDKEEEVTAVPEPEPEPVPVPVAERSTRSRGKTPVTTRTRSSQHYRTIVPGHNYDAQEEEILNIKRHPRRSSHKWDQAVPASDDTDVSDLSAAELPPSSLAPLIHPRDTKSKTDPESTIPCLLKEKFIALQPRDSPRKPLTRGPPESQKVPDSPRSCSPWKTVSKLKEKDDLPSTDVKLIKAPSREPVALFNTAILEEPEQNVDDSEIRKASISQNANDPLRCAPRGCSPLLVSKLAKRPTPSLAGSDPFTFSPVRHISSSPKSLKQQGSPSSQLAKFDLLSDRFSWKNQYMPMDALIMPSDRQPKASPFFTHSQNHGCVTMVSKESGIKVEKIAAAEQHTEVEEKDVLKQMFSNEITTPTGLSATCRRPIRGAAGRPVKSSDLWSNDSLLCAPRETSTTTSTSSSYIENRSVRRVSSLPNSSKLAVPPAGKIKAPRHGMAVWLQLLLLAVVAGFVFFVYQTMETNAINPFGGSESKPIDSDNAGKVVNK